MKSHAKYLAIITNTSTLVPHTKIKNAKEYDASVLSSINWG